MDQVFLIFNSSNQHYQGDNTFEFNEFSAIQYSSVADAETNGLTQLAYAGMYEIRPVYFITNESIAAKNIETL